MYITTYVYNYIATDHQFIFGISYRHLNTYSTKEQTKEINMLGL